MNASDAIEMADAALLILYDREQRVLLQRRDAHAPKEPGRWSFFGGALEPHETPKEAVRREAREELAYTVTNPVLVAVQKMPNNGKKYFFVEYCGERDQPRLHEGQSMHWFTIEEAAVLDMVPHHREVLKRVAEYMKNPSEETSEGSQR